MSKQSLDQVIQRASSDARFRASLGDNFDGAVRPYDLSYEERAQLAKGLGLSPTITARPMAAAVAGTVDASSVDASTVEASSADASTVEASSADASTVEASSADASTVEASTADASTVEASSVEASSYNVEDL
jgi:hypothetical protein